MRPTIITILLLSCSNLFMTFAWYAHLKELSSMMCMDAYMDVGGRQRLEQVVDAQMPRAHGCAGAAKAELNVKKYLRFNLNTRSDS